MAKRSCHYVKKRDAYVCDNCDGVYDESKRPIGFNEVPEWMLRCPVCGLKVTKTDRVEVVDEIHPLENLSLLMLRLVPEETRFSLGAQLVDCGVPRDAVRDALELGTIGIGSDDGEV